MTQHLSYENGIIADGMKYSTEQCDAIRVCVNDLLSSNGYEFVAIFLQELLLVCLVVSNVLSKLAHVRPSPRFAS